MRTTEIRQHPSKPLNLPGYRALRMAAEWSSAVRDEPCHLRFDPRTGRIVAASRTTAQVTVDTEAWASRPRVDEVVFRVEREPGGAYAGFTLTGHEASALFWGESAVEKFLLSYYASAAADDAAGFLSRLLGAWYGYPGHVVQVCALVYLCGTRPPAAETPLSLDGTVGLLCLEGREELRLLTLNEFEARYATGLPRGYASHGPHAARREEGWPVTRFDESIVAREAAEFVSGLRGRPVVFEYERDTLYPVLADDEGRGLAGGEVLFAGMADVIRPDRPAPSSVLLWVRERKTERIGVELMHGADGSSPDSVFWSDGAVERFLLPYYASVKGAESWFFNAWMMGKWNGVIPPDEADPAQGYAAVVNRFLPRFLRSAGAAPERLESAVFAMTHLPRSEYESEALEARTMVHAREEGVHTRHPLLRPQCGTPTGV